jgi:hypothetical protein
MMNEPRTSRAFGAVALALVLAAARVHAQTDDQIICPLSEQQQSDSQSTWATVGGIFKHDRCSNCHGKKNPFVANTEHPDRQTIELDEKGEESEESRKRTFAACQTCHDQVPTPWKTPPADMHWWNQSVEELCRTQHRKISPFLFIRHSENDPLIKDAFTGMMALNDVGQDIVETEPYPDPPPVGHSTFMSHIRSWYAAQGLTEDSMRWPGDQADCGCVPQHYEIETDVMFSLSDVFPGCSGTAHMNEIVQITFTAENHYMGTGTGTYTVTGLSCGGGCTIDYRPATTDVLLTGDVEKVDEVPDKLTMTAGRMVGPTSFDVTCPCEDTDCPWPVTIPVPALPLETNELPKVDARLGTYEPAVGPGGQLTITIRKRE